MSAVKSITVTASVDCAGLSIPGSKYVRAFCVDCGCAMRVPRSVFRSKPAHYCDDCRSEMCQREGVELYNRRLETAARIVRLQGDWVRLQENLGHGIAGLMSCLVQRFNA